MTDAKGHPLPEWGTINVDHFVTIYGYDFTNPSGAINYFDSATQVGAGRHGLFVSYFWEDAKVMDHQVYVP